MIKQIASEIYQQRRGIEDIVRGDTYRVPYTSVRADYSPPLSIAHNTSYTVTLFSNVVQNPGNAFVVNTQNGTISVREGIVVTFAAITASPLSSDGVLHVQSIDATTGENSTITAFIPVIIPQGNVNTTHVGSFVTRVNDSTMRFRLIWYSKTASSLAITFFYVRMLWFPRF